MAGLPIVVLSWLSLGLPLALAWLAISLARETARVGGPRRFGRAAMLCAVGLFLPFVAAAAAQGLFAATDCTGARAFEGCIATAPAYGEALHAAFWRGVRYGPLVSGLAALHLLVGALIAWRNRPRRT